MIGQIRFHDKNGEVFWFRLENEVDCWHDRGTLYDPTTGRSSTMILSQLKNGQWMLWEEVSEDPSGDDTPGFGKILSCSESVDWLLTHGYDVPQELQDVYAAKEVEGNNTNAELSREVVTLAQCARLMIGVSQKTVNNQMSVTRRSNKGKMELPKPVKAGRGPHPHQYNYGELRRWLIDKFPAQKEHLPEGYAKALDLMNSNSESV